MQVLSYCLTRLTEWQFRCSLASCGSGSQSSLQRTRAFFFEIFPPQPRLACSLQCRVLLLPPRSASLHFAGFMSPLSSLAIRRLRNSFSMLFIPVNIYKHLLNLFLTRLAVLFFLFNLLFLCIPK